MPRDDAHAEPAPDQMTDLPGVISQIGEVRRHLQRFMSSYQFAIHEVETKVRILSEEFQLLHLYNPIEHVTTRLKSPESVMAKARKRGVGPDTEAIRREIRDIAGVRVVCSFASDVYRVQQLLCAQSDIELIQLKDYIAQPKPSSYRSLHAIVEIPVFLSDETVRVPVEMQFRTIAQDFWASLEHKIFYKYERAVPDQLSARLQEAAVTAARLDTEMEQLSNEIGELGDDVASITEDTLREFLGLMSRAPRS